MSSQNDVDRDLVDAPTAPGTGPDTPTSTDTGADTGADAETVTADSPGPADGTDPADSPGPADGTDPGHGDIASDAAGPPFGPAEGADGADDETETETVTAGSWSSSTYVPPPSPAYAALPPRPVSRHARPPRTASGAAWARSAPQASASPPATSTTKPTTAPAAASTDTGEPTDSAESGDTTRSQRQGWQLLAAGLALVIMAGAVTIAAMVSGGGHDRYVFGEVSAVTGDAQVKTDGADADPRPLEEGDRVAAGWVVETEGDAAATVELTDGGVIRLDSGARIEFVDLAADQAGARAETAEPAVRLGGGRFWLNPGGTSTDELGLQVQVPSGSVATTGNPVALDCTTPCTIEAPTGGATLTTEDGARMAPAAGEQVTFRPHSDLTLAVLDAPSDWAQQNLDADGEEGLPAPRDDDTPGIAATAVLDGTYAMALEVVGPPGGDAIPIALQYPQGETYAIEMIADGGACEAVPCIVPVSAADGASGTAEIADGAVELTFKQPIDCYDETYTSVVLPGIGTTTVNATLEVGDVAYNGERWQVRTFEGTGTVAANLATRCNQGDVLGTSTSAITIAGS